jgi:elongation factor G
MTVNVAAPSEYQGPCIALLNKRKGVIGDTETSDDYVSITAEVPLNDMFGFSTDLRSSTQGKGEFTMEYKMHSPVLPFNQEKLIADYKRKLAQDRK